jgi:hypothetical protein
VHFTAEKKKKLFKKLFLFRVLLKNCPNLATVSNESSDRFDRCWGGILLRLVLLQFLRLRFWRHLIGNYLDYIQKQTKINFGKTFSETFVLF